MSTKIETNEAIETAITTKEKLSILELSLSTKKQLSKTDFYDLFKLSLECTNEEFKLNNRVPKEYQDAMSKLVEDILSPRASNRLEFPPMIIDGVMQYRCKFHECYYPEDKMVMVNGASKGYCKPVWAKWSKANDRCKSLNDEVSKAVVAGKFEEAQALAKEAELLRFDMNTPAYYDKVADWENYKPRNTTKATESEDITNV